MKAANEKGVPVLIDEAYFGFYDKTVISLTKKFNNLIVARTFSKAFGLAGCRIGYLITNKDLARELLRFRSMYEVNSFGILTGKVMMDNYNEIIEYCNSVNESKNKLCKLAANCRIPFIDTKANFIFFDFSFNKDKVIKEPPRKNVLIGAGLNVRGLEGYLRFSVGPQKEMKIIHDTLVKYAT